MNRRLLIPIVALATFAAFGADVAGSQASGNLPGTGDPAAALAETARASGPAAPAVGAPCRGDVEYCPSRAQVRVDRSFSAYPIDSLASKAGGGLQTIGDGDCGPAEGCERRDDAGVRHYLWGDSVDDLRIVIKTVEASDFAGRSIAALDIGTARDQAEVMARVRRFLPDVEFDCDPSRVSGNVGPVECGATLKPGWLQIGFDNDGRLFRVRFDGYHFL